MTLRPVRDGGGAWSRLHWMTSEKIRHGGRDLCRDRRGLLMQQIICAFDQKSLGLRHPPLAQRLTLGEERSALAAKNKQDRLNDAPCQLGIERPVADRRELDLEECRDVFFRLVRPARDHARNVAAP